ncbi:MAG: pyrimidine/purine nucleoside phosphorylase [Anaerovoracaceae bacterium]
MFKNVNVIKKANVYFDGNVTSRTVNFENGTRKTLGFMNAGKYTFNTEAAELMEVLGGAMEVRLSGEEFLEYKEGMSFIVSANSSFDVIVKDYADYCCSYNQD